MGAFWSSLVGTYSEKMLQRHTAEKKEHIGALTAQLDTLVNAAASGTVKPEYMDQVKEQINTLQDEIAGKKSKGGFHLSNLIGKFQDVGGSTDPGAARKQNQPAKGGAGTTGAAVAAPGAVPAVGQPPTRQSGVGEPPTRASFGEIMTKGTRSKADMISEEEIARTKARISTMDEADKKKIADAATEYKKAHPEATDREVYDKVVGPLTGIKVEDGSERERIKQEFTMLRDENRQRFQLQLETMKEKSAEVRQNRHDEMMMRAMGARMTQQDRERMKITPAQINLEINGTLTTMRQELNQASRALAAATKAAQDKSGSMFKMFKDDPDVAGATRDVQNMQAAIAHIERHRGAIISGKKELDDVIDEAQAIMLGGSNTIPPGAEPDAVIDTRKNPPNGKR